MSDVACPFCGARGTEHCTTKDWARWFERADRIVAKTKVGDAEVSTVFLGLDHSFGAGPQLWFETMVFGGEHDGDQDRYTTWDEAIAGHARFVNRVTDQHSAQQEEKR